VVHLAGQTIAFSWCMTYSADCSLAIWALSCLSRPTTVTDSIDVTYRVQNQHKTVALSDRRLLCIPYTDIIGYM